MRRLNREIHAFQPTPSLRRATTASEIRAMRYAISTHALLAEGDEGRDKIMAKPSIFQPTPSLRRATRGIYQAARAASYFNPRPPCGGRQPWKLRARRCLKISTHALLAEGDQAGRRGRQPGGDISTHALLAEGDHKGKYPGKLIVTFQPTPSLRRATFRVVSARAAVVRISTHALLAEGDTAVKESSKAAKNFNPRPPCGGRR